jgi:hypothetical protein
VYGLNFIPVEMEMAHLPNANRVAKWLLLSAMAGTRLLAQKAPVTDKDVLPIVQRCTQCHGGDVQMGSLDLRTRASILFADQARDWNGQTPDADGACAEAEARGYRSLERLD